MADEEAVGFKCFNLLIALGIRGVALPDACHQQWGDYGRAIDACGLRGATLKLTLICAFGSGPYTSGRNHFTTERAASLLLAGKDDEWFDSFLPGYAFDQRRPETECILTAEQWLDSPGISNRLKKDWGSVSLFMLKFLFSPAAFSKRVVETRMTYHIIESMIHIPCKR